MATPQQHQKQAEHGSFLQPASVYGARVDFINSTTIGSAVVTLNATGDASNLDFGVFTVGFDYIENGNIFPWSSTLAWIYANFYIDGAGLGPGFDANLYRIGASVSGSTAPLRKPMLIDIFPNTIYVPATTLNHSHVWRWYMKNNDSSSHTVGIYTQSKYIKTGGIQ